MTFCTKLSLVQNLYIIIFNKLGGLVRDYDVTRY